MMERSYVLLAGAVFLVIALAHLLRLAIGATVVVQGVAVPMWASVLALLLMGFLAYEALRLARKGPR